MNKKKLKNIVNSFSDKTSIIVIGDLIADIYVEGCSIGLSRSSSVPVVKKETEETYLGGAGNVILNIKTMGGNPIPVSYIGKDWYGNYIINALERKQITTAYIKQWSDESTKKIKILTKEETGTLKHLLHIDSYNKPAILMVDPLHKVLNNKTLQYPIIISDYGRGTVPEEIIKYFDYMYLQKKGKTNKVYVDSRYRLNKFSGVEAVFPNREELKNYVCDTILPEYACNRVIDELICKYVVAKRDIGGVLLKEADPMKESIEQESLVKNLVDTTGAGDSFLAAFVLAIENGATKKEALILGSIAAAIQCEHNRTYAVTKKDLLKGIDDRV